MTNDVKKTRNSLMITTVVLGIICMVIGVFFTSDKIACVLGVAIGVVICLFRVISMTKSLEKVVDMSPDNANNYAKAMYMFRYVVSLAIAIGACYLRVANPIGVIVGLLLLQPATYIYNFIDARIKQ